MNKTINILTMTQAVQMDFNFDEPTELEAFVRKLMEKKIPEAEIYEITDRLTNHFEEMKTKELIHELVEFPFTKELAEVHFVKRQSLNTEENRIFRKRMMERESLRKAAYPQIFTEGGYKRFQKTVDFYTKDDHKLKAKFSNLYHYFKYEHLLICTQLEYIAFVRLEYEVHLSKILPTTLKYQDNILPLLARISKLRQIE